MHTVEDLENTLKDIFITTESTYNQQVELENLLEEVDPQSLIRTIWENSETIYSFRTEKNREQCMEYCESELFKKWVTLLYSENGSGSPIDAQTINLWLLHDAGFLVTADFYLALDGNEYVTECRLYKGVNWECSNLDYSGTWGHDELHYMNGWTSGEATWMTTLHTIGSFDGPACYCIEPGVPRLLEKTYTRYGEDYPQK